jgi:transcriptional regulator with XRE-family HTH domain
MNTPEYIDAYKASIGITSDYALAKYLNVTRSYISSMQNGRVTLSESLARQIAAQLGIHAGLVLIDMQREKASTPEEKTIWKDIFQGFQTLLLPAELNAVYDGLNRRSR